MKTRSFFLGTLVLCLGACSNGSNYESIQASDSVSAEVDDNAVGSVAGNSGASDTTRKFLRTADVKFEAENAIQSTTAIEDAVVKQGGFITLSGLESEVFGKEVTEISADSMLEITSFRVVSHMVLRVPTQRLDTVLKSIAKEVKFLDSRSIKADDVSLAMLSNKLTMKRLSKYGDKPLTVKDENGKVISSSLAVADSKLEKQGAADETFVNQLSLEDQVNYSTVILEIYQHEQFRKVMMENSNNHDRYEPSLFSRIWASLVTGWRILESIIVGLLKIWPILVLIGVGYVLFRKYGSKENHS